MEQKATFRGVVRVLKEFSFAQDGSFSVLGPAQIARTYDPFRTETGLFLQFAALRPGRGEQLHVDPRAPGMVADAMIVAFAMQYGLPAQSMAAIRERIGVMADAVRQWRSGAPEPFQLENAGLSLFCPNWDGMEIVSDDLWTCLRIQFNLAVLNGWNFRECTQCGKPFAIIPPATRKNRVYCSAACSAAAHRDRKKDPTSKGTKRVTSKTGKPPAKGSRRRRGAADK